MALPTEIPEAMELLPRELELASGIVANRKEEPRIAPTICTVIGKAAIL
jgi:hypothetical protein